MLTNKINSKLQNFNFWKIFPLIVFMFNPKIDLIPIPGYWQGIRLDDLIVLFYSIFFFFQNKGTIYPKMINLNMQGFNWIIFFPYLVFSLIVGKIFGIDVEWIISLRFLEYIALIIILNELDVPKKTIISLIKVYIIVNFVCVLLQYFDLIGAVSSRGFSPWGLTDPELVGRAAAEKYHGFLKDVLIPPGGILNNRSPGITGGAWELSTIISICIFALYAFEKNIIKILPYFLLSLTILFIAQSRGIIFGFIVGFLFLIKEPRKIFNVVSFIIIVSILMYFLNLFEFQKLVHQKIFINYFEIIKLAIGAFTGNVPPYQEILQADTAVISTGLESFHHRATVWNTKLSALKDSWVLIFFGLGGDSIYVDSLVIRIIYSFGLVGTIFIIYLARNVPFYFIIFCLVTGITLDLFISFKIFTFSYLLLLLHKKIVQ